MKMYFKTRTEMRSAKFGQPVDLGSDAPQGRRWARVIERKTK